MKRTILINGEPCTVLEHGHRGSFVYLKARRDKDDGLARLYTVSAGWWDSHVPGDSLQMNFTTFAWPEAEAASPAVRCEGCSSTRLRIFGPPVYVEQLDDGTWHSSFRLDEIQEGGETQMECRDCGRTVWAGEAD